MQLSEADVYGKLLAAVAAADGFIDERELRKLAQLLKLDEAQLLGAHSDSATTYLAALSDKALYKQAMDEYTWRRAPMRRLTRTRRQTTTPHRKATPTETTTNITRRDPPRHPCPRRNATWRSGAASTRRPGGPRRAWPCE